LHEYRQQQADPAPPAETGAKQIKRKASAFGLNAIERVPSSPSTPRRAPRRSFTPPQQRSTAEVSSVLPFSQAQSFVSISSPAPSIAIQPPPLQEASENQLEDPSSSEAEHFYRSHERYNDFSKNFKPIKRLPRRSALDPPVTAPLRSSSSSAGGLTNSSTFSLSRFPQPPQFAEVDPSPPEPSRQYPVSEATAPSSPAVLHYRGASFDVVNPHKSLLFSSFETPGDRDAELTDYFHATPSKLRLVSEAAMALQAAHDSDTQSTTSQGKAGPPRALYDDLSAAYQGIRAASLRNGQTRAAPMLDLPLPPRPAIVSSNQTRYSKLDSSEDMEGYRPQPLNINKQVAPPSFMQRMSRAFRRKKSNSKSGPHIVSEDSRDLLPIAEQRASTYHPRPLARVSGVNQSAPAVSGETERDVDAIDYEGRVSMSEGDLAAAQGYYDMESIYPSSNFMLNDAVSVYDSRRSIPFGVRTRETDYSSEVDPQSYIYEFVNSPRTSERLSRGKLNDQLFRHSSAALGESQKDNTLASIYDQYQGDLSQASLRDLIDAEAEHEDAIRISGIDQVYVGDNKPRTSGLSQFDFGIERASSSGSSSVPSPKTPQQPMFPPPMTRLFSASAGLPPSMPLPLQPAIDLMAPQPPFARRDFSSDISDMHSHTSSYGGTRNLLLTSQQLTPSNLSQSHHSLAAESTLSAVASSAALPEDDAGQKPSKRQSASDLLDLSTTRSSLPLPERSRSAIERVVAEEVKRLSQSSSVSRLSGSIFLVSNGGTPRTASVQASSHALPSDAEASSSEDSLKRETDTARLSIVFADASSKANQSDIPTMWRRISPFRPSGKENESPGDHSVADVTDEGDEQDWETVADMSRPDLRSQASEDSIADFSTFVSVNSLQRVKVHPGDRRYQHEYRLQSHSDSRDPVLLPSYDFRGGNGFPNRNALTPLRAASNPYRYPSPLAEDHVHPFSSSPPMSLKATPARHVKAGSEEEGGVAQSGNPDDYSPSSDASGRSRVANGPEGRQGFSMSTTTFDVVPQPTYSGMLSSEPNDEILYETYEPMPFQHPMEATPQSAYLPDSSDRAFQQLDASNSPARERDNSFAKLTYLGPKGNLTGTLEGNGMREVGSSLANTSSPGANLSSTPSRRFVSSPLAQHQYSSSPEYDAVDFATRAPAVTSSHIAQASETSTYSKDSKDNSTSFFNLHWGQRESLQKEGLLGSTHQQAEDLRRGPSGRAAVPGQTKLREMRLVRPPNTSSETITDIRLPQAAGAESAFTEKYSPLRSKEPFASHRNVYSGEEHLQPFGRPESSVCSRTRTKKQRLSWIIFFMLFWFPPFLVLYGFGKTDFLMVWFSKGEILHCSRFHKRLALWTGITMSVVLPVAVIVILVLYHFGFF